MYRLAQTLHGISFADFISDLNDGIPLSDACVETIIASDVLENIMKPYTFLAEMNSHLKDGGIAFINIPFMYCVHEAHMTIIGILHMPSGGWQ